jgi:hypothetical protein
MTTPIGAVPIPISPDMEKLVLRYFKWVTPIKSSWLRRDKQVSPAFIYEAEGFVLKRI